MNIQLKLSKLIQKIIKIQKSNSIVKSHLYRFLMTDNKPQGIKATLEEIDSEILTLQKDLSDNEIRVVNLKNEKSRLGSIFESKCEQIQRNLRIDLESFQTRIRDSFRTHNNMLKMLDKKITQISDNQVQLAETLLQINDKVQQMQAMIG